MDAVDKFTIWSNLFGLLVPLALFLTGWIYDAQLEVIAVVISLMHSMVYHFCRAGECPEETNFDATMYTDVKTGFLLMTVMASFLLRTRAYGGGPTLKSNRRDQAVYLYVMVPGTLALLYGTGVNNDKTSIAIWVLSCINFAVIAICYMLQAAWMNAHRKVANETFVIGDVLRFMGMTMSVLLFVVYAILRLVREYDETRISYSWHGIEHIIAYSALAILVGVQPTYNELRKELQDGESVQAGSSTKKVATSGKGKAYASVHC